MWRVEAMLHFRAECDDLLLLPAPSTCLLLLSRIAISLRVRFELESEGCFGWVIQRGGFENR